MKLKQLSTEFKYFTPKWQIFGFIQLRIIAYIFILIYELPLCKILYQYINKYGYYKYIPIFHKILTILPPK